MAGTDVALAGRTDLAIDATQSAWTDDQVAVLRQIGTPNATPADLKLFFHQCVRTGLDPFARQIYLVDYGGKATIQTGIDGFRVVARRAADASADDLEYEDTQWCGPDGVWTDVWLQPGPPAAARAVVLRGGKRFSAVALYAEYVGMRGIYEYTNGKKRKIGEEPNSMWTGKPAHMIGKCAEAAVLRKAFPQDLGGLYVAEEMDRRATVEGEVVRDEPATASPGERLAAAVDLVTSATTEDELRGIWSECSPGLGVAERGSLSAAIRAALGRLAATPEPEPAAPPAAEPEDEATIVADSEDAPPY